MPEVQTDPIVSHRDNGDELVTFGPEHSWADVVRWIAKYPGDIEDVRELIARIDAGCPPLTR